MAIHAPAHRPAFHFHLATPHVGEAWSDLLTGLALGGAALAIAWASTAVAGPDGIDAARTVTGYDVPASGAAYDGSATVQAAGRILAPAPPAALALAWFRLEEHGYPQAPTALQNAAFRLEEHGYPQVPTALQSAAFRLEEHGYVPLGPTYRLGR